MKPSRALVVGAVAGVLLAASAALAASLPAWDRKIAGPARFKVLSAFGGAAVLDKETGLVWEKTASLVGNYNGAVLFCSLRNTGGRMGWRLPAVEELTTLVDPAQQTPALPDGAPFVNVLGAAFWTANDLEGDPAFAVTVSLDVFTLSAASKSGSSRKVLCVRAGRGSTNAGRVF